MIRKLTIQAVFAYFIMFFGFTAVGTAGNKGLEVGETIPNPEFFAQNLFEYDQMPRTVRLQDYKQDKVLLLAIMPDISSKNTYGQVMTAAFDTYFAEKLAFIKEYYYDPKADDIKVLVVTNNDEAAVKEYLTAHEIDFDMVSDINTDFANFFGINKWNDGDASHVYVIGKDNKITFADYDYKGQGEKLKLVQKELASSVGIDNTADPVYTSFSPLMPGDDAREFSFTYLNKYLVAQNPTISQNGNLADYIGKKNVILAFYPAPFSMSCMMEVSKFDKYAEESGKQYIDNIHSIGAEENLEIMMISMSNIEILSKWSTEMGLDNVTLISDHTGEISSKYSSFNPLGYNNRTIFLIDKAGKIAYIDWDYEVGENDFNILEKQLKNLN